jgi:hypothetical protein
MRVEPVKLIQFIVCQATECEASLTPIRVVKFLYLADLYHARENKGETLTGWPWKFVYFGPYCTESFLALKRAVDDGLIIAKPFESKYDDKDRFLYSCPSEEGADFEGQLSIYVWSSLKEAIKKWADDTPGLLDHVYYDTEPMEEAKRGDLLDSYTIRSENLSLTLEKKWCHAKLGSASCFCAEGEILKQVQDDKFQKFQISLARNFRRKF